MNKDEAWQAPTNRWLVPCGYVINRFISTRRLPMHYNPTLAFALLTTVVGAAVICHAEEPLRLMPMIVEWQYPDSKINGASMSDAATVNRSGKRTVPSILCKTVLTTKDPMAKVIEYYETKLKQRGDSETAKQERKSESDSGRSVMFHDDSQGRPLRIHIIIVNTGKSSTTLVISRAETESETHIAWTHYIRF